MRKDRLRCERHELTFYGRSTLGGATRHRRPDHDARMNAHIAKHSVRFLGSIVPTPLMIRTEPVASYIASTVRGVRR